MSAQAGGVGHLSSTSVSTQQPCAEHPRVSARSTILSSALTGVTCVVLLLLGALVGLLSTLNAAWMTRYWDAGHPVPILAVTGLLVFLAALYTLCRALAWGSRRPSGAVAFAIGFCVILLVAISCLPGGDVLLREALIHQGYILGSMVVLALAVVRSMPGWANPFLYKGPPVSPSSH